MPKETGGLSQGVRKIWAFSFEAQEGYRVKYMYMYIGVI